MCNTFQFSYGCQIYNLPFFGGWYFVNILWDPVAFLFIHKEQIQTYKCTLETHSNIHNLFPAHSNEACLEPVLCLCFRCQLFKQAEASAVVSLNPQYNSNEKPKLSYCCLTHPRKTSHRAQHSSTLTYLNVHTRKHILREPIES